MLNSILKVPGPKKRLNQLKNRCFEKSKTIYKYKMFFILSSIITGRSWADHGATMGDHAKHSRFQSPDPSEGVANIKFSAFLEMNNMFFKISNVLFRYS